MKSQNLFILGLIVHAIFLFVILDLYFKSPVVPNVPTEKNDLEPLADRVVQITVEGLRFDSLFDKDPKSGEDVAPYILKVGRERGALGTSQCHLPTESRPGHVAILAGVYEDPSALTVGWDHFPVPFDSVVSRSVCSFAWAHPEILRHLYWGFHHDCVYVDTYDHEEEKSFQEKTVEYDNWVYKKLNSFFQDQNNHAKLRKKGILFFLHFFGQDQVDYPHTFQYRQNLKNVDRLVKEIETLFRTFYQDNRTAFIFTSNHGKTDRGTHGGGDPSETKTPIVAWGAGIKNIKSPFGTDIHQADIAPLIAVLLGISIPVNSVGVLPGFYLNVTEKDMARAMFLNARQICKQLQTKMKSVKEQSFKWFFWHFDRLPEGELESMEKAIYVHLHRSEIAEAQRKSVLLIDLCTDALDYYHNYHRIPILVSTTLSYLGWIIHLILELLNEKEKLTFRREWFLTKTFASSGILTVIMVIVRGLPFRFCFYYLLPQVLWFLVFQKLKSLKHFLKKTIKEARYIILIGIVIPGLEILTAVYFARWILSISIGIILSWSVTSLMHSKSLTVTLLWIFSGITLIIYPFIPVSKNVPNIFAIFSSGALLFVFSLFSTYYYMSKENFGFSVVRCMLIAASVWNSLFIHRNFNFHYELSIFRICFSWCLLCFSFVSLFIGSGDVVRRLQQTFIGLAVPFIFFSTNDECFFLLALFVNLFCWVHIEYFTNSNVLPNPSVGVSDFRRAYFILTYLYIAFFGTENISDLNDFHAAWIRFLTKFSSPFSYPPIHLISLKILIPFLAVTCSIRALIVYLDIKPDRLFVIVLVYCNFMGLNFLYVIKNKGMWSEIGTSVSNYVIQQAIVPCLVLLYGVAKFLMSFSLLHSSKTLSLPSFTSGSKIRNS